MRATHGTTRVPALLTALLILYLLAVLPRTAHAQWGAELRTQMGFGGDALPSVTYPDGGSSDLTLGKLFTVTLGPSYALWRSGGSALVLQAMAGWSRWNTGPKDSDDRLEVNRFPVEALALYAQRLGYKGWVLRLGGGGVYHIGGGVRGRGSLESYELDFDNAFGMAGEVSVASGMLSLGVRYTRIRPVVEGVGMDGSSIGVFVSMVSM